MLTVGKRELEQCITDLAGWHVLSGFATRRHGDTANGRMGEWATGRVTEGAKRCQNLSLVRGLPGGCRIEKRLRRSHIFIARGTKKGLAP